MRLKATAFGAMMLLAPATGFAVDLKGSYKDTKGDLPYHVGYWNGYYVGASIGYGYGRTDYYLDEANHGAAVQESDGFTASVTGGRNWQFPSGLVLGIEGDLGYGDVTGEGLWQDDHLLSSEYNFWATLRGRAGYAYNRFLFFATAGAAYLDTHEVFYGAGRGQANAGQTSVNESNHWGWVAGLGVEYAVTERITTKAEWLHMEFGEFEGRNGNNDRYTFENNFDILRVGLNYKF